MRNKVLMVLAILCIICGMGMIWYRFSMQEEVNKEVEIVENVIEEYVNIPNNSEVSGASESEVSNSCNLVDLLKEAFNNEDVIAYIYFKDANISYPIVQGSDNERYLSTNIWGKYSGNGAIFLDSDNSPDFSDACSLIYGHHMRNGSMFGSLEGVLKDDIKGKYFNIYTRDKKLTYSIVATEILNPESRGMYYQKGNELKSNFLTFLKNNSVLFNEDVTGKQFVTLVTCHYNNGYTLRYGATGVLTSVLECYNKEDIR